MKDRDTMEPYLPILTERGRRWVRFGALVVSILLLFWIALSLSEVLTPIVAALAIAYILNPAVTWLESRMRIRRVTSILIGLSVLVLLGLVALLGVSVQAIELAGNVPRYTRAGIQWVDQSFPGLVTTPAELSQSPAAGEEGTPTTAPTTQPASTSAASRQLADLAAEHGLAVVRPVIAYVANMLSNAFYWFSLTFLLPMYTFFFLLHFNTLVKLTHDHLPSAYRETIVRVVVTIDDSIARFFRGRVVVCFFVGMLTGVGWLLIGRFTSGVPYSLVLGVLAGMLNLVPFLSVLALPPALLLTYFQAASTGEPWAMSVMLVFGVYALVQGIESFVLTPLITSQSSGLHAVTTVIALLIGGQVAGVLGMLLAIPVASTLKSLSIEYMMPEVRRLAGWGAEEQAASATNGGVGDTPERSDSQPPPEEGRS